MTKTNLWNERNKNDRVSRVNNMEESFVWICVFCLCVTLSF